MGPILFLSLGSSISSTIQGLFVLLSSKASGPLSPHTHKIPYRQERESLCELPETE